MLHPCPSCGTQLNVSSPAALAQAPCPRCGADLTQPARPQVPPKRAALVVGVFAACLLIPVALCLLLLLPGSAEPEEITPQRVAQQSDKPARSPAPPSEPVKQRPT